MGQKPRCGPRCCAPGLTAPIMDLMTACGMGRSWVYYRLREHARAGRAVQTTRGSWWAVRPGTADPGHLGTSPGTRPTVPPAQ